MEAKEGRSGSALVHLLLRQHTYILRAQHASQLGRGSLGRRQQRAPLGSRGCGCASTEGAGAQRGWEECAGRGQAVAEQPQWAQRRSHGTIVAVQV